ncbi:ankyrin repeat-containing domain protein [Xylariomycetidae sp. FL2044]|nr:ankyrin repeat-containing domain protein [Xylariomycetidae sp. FL2044]
MPPDEWEKHKADILHLFLLESLPLHRVVARMSEQHGFEKKKSQYEYQLKKWGIKKKLSKDIWRYVAHKARQKGGQVPRVTLFGLPYPEDKVRREMRRYQSIPTAEEYRSRVPSPKMPAGDIVRVMSPKLENFNYTWPRSLPWFRFWEPIPMTLTRPLAMVKSLLATYEFSNALIRISGHDASTVSPTAMKNPLLLYARINHLSQSIPGYHVGERQQVQSLLRAGDPSSIATELLKVVFFRLSNNLDDPGSAEDQIQHDRFVLCLVNEVSRSNPELLTHLLTTRCPTIDAIKEAVYGSAVRQRRYTMVSQLLESGVHPDMKVDIPWPLPMNPFSFRRGRTSLQLSHLENLPWLVSGLFIASIDCDAQLGSILLRAGANIQSEPNTVVGLLEMAAHSKDHGRALAFVRLLAEHGANINSDRVSPEYNGRLSPLALAIAMTNNPLADFLVEHGAEFKPFIHTATDDRRSGWGCPHINHLGIVCTPLQVAIMSGNVEMTNRHLKHVISDITNPLRTRLLRETLITACLAGDTPTAMEILNTGLDINEGWDDGITPLVATAWNPDNQVAGMLLRSGTHLGPTPAHRAQPCGLLPLHIAASSGNTELIEWLIARGADCNITYEHLGLPIPGYLFLPRQFSILPRQLSKLTPLQLALRGREWAAATVLLAHTRLAGDELVYVARSGSGSLFQQLISRGADICAVDSEGTTVLDEAVEGDRPEIVSLYFSCGGTYRSSALRKAVEAGVKSNDHEMVRVLVKHRSTKDIDSDEADALITSINNGDWSLTQLLLSSPFLPGRAAGLYKGTPLWAALVSHNEEIIGKMLHQGYGHQAADLRYYRNSETDKKALYNVRRLFWSSIPPEYMDLKLRQILLCCVVRLGDHQWLLECVSYVESYDFYDDFDQALYRTPLQHAAYEGDIEPIRILLQAGANINAPAYFERGATALVWAVIRGHFETVLFLLQQGADVNALPAKRSGRTALEAAAEHGRLDMIGILREKGVDMQGAMRIYYVRSVALARNNGHFAVAELLETFGGWSDRDQELLERYSLAEYTEPVFFVYNQEMGDWRVMMTEYDTNTGEYHDVPAIFNRERFLKRERNRWEKVPISNASSSDVDDESDEEDTDTDWQSDKGDSDVEPNVKTIALPDHSLIDRDDGSVSQASSRRNDPVMEDFLHPSLWEEEQTALDGYLPEASGANRIIEDITENTLECDTDGVGSLETMMRQGSDEASSAGLPDFNEYWERVIAPGLMDLEGDQDVGIGSQDITFGGS